MSRPHRRSIRSLACSLSAATLLSVGSPAFAGSPLFQDTPSISPPAGAGSEWVSSIERSLAAREYEASATPRGLQAPNRAQGFRTYFDADGLRVVDRTATERPGRAKPLRLRLLRVELDGVRLDRDSAATETSLPVASGARVETVRGGWSEHAVNGPAGLRFGATIPAGLLSASMPQAGPQAVRQLVVEWEVSGASLGPVEAAVASADGNDRVALQAASGRRFELRRLPATEVDVEVGDSGSWLLVSRL